MAAFPFPTARPEPLLISTGPAGTVHSHGYGPTCPLGAACPVYADHRRVVESRARAKAGGRL